MLKPTRATGISASASTVSAIRTVNRFAREGRTYLSCRLVNGSSQRNGATGATLLTVRRTAIIPLGDRT